MRLHFSPTIAKIFGYKIRDGRASTAMENEWPIHEQLKSFLCFFLWIFCSHGSRTFFTCCTMIFFKSICHKLHTSFICLCSRPSWSWLIVYAHNHNENDYSIEKPYYGPLWTYHKHYSKHRGFLWDFCCVKFRYLMYDLWSEIVTLPDTPAYYISSFCKTNVEYTIDTMNTRASFLRLQLQLT